MERIDHNSPSEISERMHHATLFLARVFDLQRLAAAPKAVKVARTAEMLQTTSQQTCLL
jgi:hypothetical protein